MTDFAPIKGLSQSEIAVKVEQILAEATLTEKVGMMSGKGFFAGYREDGGIWGARPYRAGSGIERLSVPPLYFTDGPRGVARGESTCFPCTMARGATFDPDLERRIGEAMSIEIRAQGCTLSGAICVNLLRHPAWGRAQETYGEDPHHLGVMGTALGLGLQTHNVIATVKHFALNSIENARFTVDVSIDERALHEVYLSHFKTIIDAGIASVMSAYNKVNGEYCGQDRVLLTNILRGEWGFSGFVHSDWVMGVYQPYGASAGLDIENPEPLVFGDKLLAGVNAGDIEPYVIDTACRRILATQYRFACAEDPLPDYPLSLVAGADHVALALEAAEKSAVLLENDGMLPLSSPDIGKLAVIGRLADMANTGDNGSSRVRAPYVVTALAGLTAHLGQHRIMTGDESDLETARMATERADAVIVVVGYTAEEEGEYIPGDIALGQEGSISPDTAHVPGEFQASRPARPNAIGGDRLSLGLPANQLALIDLAIESGKPVTVVIVAGSAVMVEGWHDRVNAILQVFYSGMEGGTALARMIFGNVSPSGKLPFTVAKDEADYPVFNPNAKAITYDQWHGYAKFAQQGLSARYGFGHGLSYTSFACKELAARVVGESIEISINVSNTGKVAAETVVFVYITPPGEVERWPHYLKAFQRVSLAAGETILVNLTIEIQSLRYRDAINHCWELEHGRYVVSAGTGYLNTFLVAGIEP